MIKSFITYINESKKTRKSMDELEVLTPDQLGKILIDEASRSSMDVRYIKDLIAVGCPIDFRDDCERTALHHASDVGNLEVVELLVSNGADVNIIDKYSWTALQFAANSMGNEDILKYLISKGAQVGIRDNNGRIPWDFAYYNAMKEVPELNPNK